MGILKYSLYNLFEMKKIYTAILSVLLLVSLASKGQFNGYSFSTSTGNTLDPMTGSVALVSASSDDGASAVTNIGFTFSMLGTSYTQFSANVNGLVRLGGTAVTTAYSNSTTSSAFNPKIMPLWDDHHTGTVAGGGKVSTVLIGTPGSQIRIVEWFVTVPRNTTGAADSRFQLWLYEGSNKIEFRYGTSGGTLSSATIGLSNATATTGDYNIVNSTTAHTNSTSAVSDALTAWPGSGRAYTFTPPVPCTGTPNGGTAAPSNQTVCSGATPGAITVANPNPGTSGYTYQWQESLDYGATWANVTTGTGATTLSYTPAAFTSATPIYYRLVVTCTGSAQTAYSSSAYVSPIDVPSTNVSNVGIGMVSPTSINITWTNGNGNRRLVIVSNTTITNPANGSGPAITANTAYAGGQQIVYDGTGTSVAVTGLTCGATYHVKVYEYNRCGTAAPYTYYYNTTGTEYTPEIIIGAQSLPLSNNFTNFNGYNLNTAYPNWDEATSATVNSPASAPSSFGSSSWQGGTLGGTSARINLYSTGKKEWILSPKVTIPATGSYRLRFDAAITDFTSNGADPAGMQGTDDWVAVYKLDNCLANPVELFRFNAANTTTLTNVLTNYILDLSAYTGQDIYIGFYGTEGTVDDAPDYDFHIDNINIEATPLCDPPTGITIGSITNNTASISFTPPSTAPSNGYEYVVSTTNTAPTGTGIAATGSPISVSGLTGNTTYYVFVRSNCGGTSSAWTSSVSFTTGCDPLTIPWTENFDALTTVGATVFPSCWRKENGDWATANTSTTTYSGPYSTPNYLRESWSTTGAEYIWTPGFTLNASTSYDLSFMLRGYSGDADWTAGVYVNTVQSSTGGSIAQVGTNFLNNTNSFPDNNYFKVTRTFVPATAGTYYFAIKVEEPSANPWYLGFDDFSLALTPTCFPPTALTVSGITGTSANVSFTAPTLGTPVSYEYFVSSTNTAPNASTTPTGTGITGTTINVTGLSAATQYYVWVRSNCGSETSAWSSSATFTTNYTCGSNFYDTGGATGNYGNSEVYYRYFTPTPGSFISLNFSSFATELNWDTLTIYNGPNETYPEIGRFHGTASPGVVTSTDPSGALTIRFRSDGSGVAAGWAATVSCVTCLPPTNVATSMLTNNSVQVNWSGTGDMIIEYGAAGFTPGTGATAGTGGTIINATASPASITGLSSNTAYDVYVRKDCGAGDFSTNVKLSITTSCDPISTLPWTENFDAVTPIGTTNFPACWREQAVGGNFATSDAASYSNTDPRSTPNYLTKSYDVSPYNADYMWTPGFTLQGGQSYDFKFWMQGDGAIQWGGQVLVSNYQDSASAYTVLGDSIAFRSVVVPTTYTQVMRQFTPSTTGTYYFAVKALSYTTAPSNLGFDDFSLALTPNCQTPNSLTATLTSGTTASVSFVDPNTPAVGNYEYFLSAANDATAPTAATTATGTATASPFTVSGLTTPDTFYVYVRAVCDPGVLSSAWSAPVMIVANYCTPAPTSVDGSGITNVNVNNGAINNTTTAETGNYGNYSNLVADAQQYSTVTVNITYATLTYDYQTKIWIDWNDDYDFNDAGEEVYYGTSGTTSPNTLNASFLVPLNAPLGQHRMRIGGLDAGGTNGVNVVPCYTGTYGTFEDYTINVTPAPSCLPPTGAASVPNGPTGATISFTAPPTAPAFGYDYYYSTTNTAPGAATVPNGNVAASPINVTGLTSGSTYYFWVRSNCAANDQSSWVSAGSVTLAYCTPSSTSGSVFVDNVTLTGPLGTLNNTASGTGYTTGGYANYTALSFSTYNNNQLSVSIKMNGTSASNTGGLFAWIDFNNNLIFESSELIYNSYTTANSYAPLGVYNFVVDIPNLTPGNYRMRVMTDYYTSGGSLPINPCAFSSTGPNGEAEDYTIQIVQQPTTTMDWVNLSGWTSGGNAPYDPNAGTTPTGGAGVIAYTQGYEAGVTPGAGAGAGITVWIGVSQETSSSTFTANPNTWTKWYPATYTGEVGNNDLYLAAIGADLAPGNYKFASRWQFNYGPFVYGGYNGGSTGGGIWDGVTYVSGDMTVVAPLNDDICGAVVLNNTVGGCTNSAGTTLGATASTTTPAPTCSATGANDDVWYQFTATGTSHTIAISNTSSTIAAAVYSSSDNTCSGTLTQVACFSASQNTITTVSGNTYFIRVYTTSTLVGTTSGFNICISSPPANDNCTGAIAIGPVPVDGTCVTLNNQSTYGATNSNVTPAGSCSSNSGTPDDDVWYSFTATNQTHKIQFTYVSGNSDIYYQVFSAACNATTKTTIQCSDNNAGGTVTGLTIGNTYYIRMYTYGANQVTTQNICISTPLQEYVSSVVTQSSTATVTAGATNQQIVRLGVTVIGTVNPKAVTAITFNNTSTNTSDIATAKVYYTTNSTFSTTNLFGTVTNPGSTFTVTGTQTLPGGTSNTPYFFWLVYDISCSAPSVTGNVADASVVSFVYDGNTRTDMTTPDPDGSRTITGLYLTSAQTDPNTNAVVGLGSVNNQMARVNLAGSTACPRTVNALDISVTSTSSPATNITGIRVYYTTTATFSTANLFGTGTVPAASGVITVTGSQATATSNYFWVVYDIACSATRTDVVNASIQTIHYQAGASTPVTGTTTDNPIDYATTWTTVADGEWSNPATWNNCGMIPPTLATNVVIAHNVTVAQPGAIAGNVTVNSGASLAITTGDLTMGGGTYEYNKVFTNNGTLNVSGGTLNVNGRYYMASNATLIQSGGNINVDGNDNGNTSTSVPSGSYLVYLAASTPSNIQLTGGTFTLVDPHAASTFALYATISAATGVAAGPNHVFNFGDGISSTSGTTNGFYVNTWAGTGIFSFGDVNIINPAGSINRFVFTNPTSSYSQFVVNDDLTIDANSELRNLATDLRAATVIGGSIMNDGIFTSQGYLTMGKMTSAGSTTVSESPSDQLQVIGGTGIYRNSLLATPTANLTNLKINNSHSQGFDIGQIGVQMTLNLSVSSELVMQDGIIVTEDENQFMFNTLTLGTSPANTGTLTYVNGFVKGKLARWVGQNTNAYQFPVGTVQELPALGNWPAVQVKAVEMATIQYATAPATGGILTATWLPGVNDWPNASPLTENGNTPPLIVNAVAREGVWQIIATEGLETESAPYTGTFVAKDIPSIIDYTKLVLVKRPNTGADWTLDGTHVPTTGSNSLATLQRTGMVGFSQFGIGGEWLNALPVVLEYFKGIKVKESDNKLYWKVYCTDDRPNTIELQRAGDGINFSMIHSLVTTPQSCATEMIYHDYAPLNGNNYYRLRMVDADGKVSFSNVVLLNNSVTGLQDITLYPNPAASYTNIRFTSGTTGKASMNVYDQRGRVVMNKTVAIITGVNTINLSVGHLAKGQYTIALKPNEGAITTLRFIKD